MESKNNGQEVLLSDKERKTLIEKAAAAHTVWDILLSNRGQHDVETERALVERDDLMAELTSKERAEATLITREQLAEIRKEQ